MTDNEKNPETKETKKSDLSAVLDILKVVGLIGGSLGSLTVLFFWLGNAIVVARLRVYNLYGTIRYSDEYVKEAGFQFLTDVFTFFGRETLYGLFIIAIFLIFILIPIGPYQREERKAAKNKRKETGKTPTKWWGWRWPRKTYLDERIRYGLFITMVVVVSFFLISDHKFWILSNKILNHEETLKKASLVVTKDSAAFVPKTWENKDRPKKEFYRQIVEGIEPEPDKIKDWLIENLSKIYPAKQIKRDNLGSIVKKFQSDIGIKEDFDLDKEVGPFYSTKSYCALLSIQVNPRLKEGLRDQIADARRTLEDHLSLWLKSDTELSTFVISPASYEVVNHRIGKLKDYASNVLLFFNPTDQETRQILTTLSNLKTIHFCGFILSFSFWILVGLIIYLLFNVSNFFGFRRWEQVYFLSAALLFVIIAVVVPNAYGKYKFEFRIQEIRPILMEDEEKEDNTKDPARHLMNMIKNGAVLYTLGPTRDKEVIIAAMHFKNEVRIILLDKDAMRNMTLRPVQPGEIPPVISLLRKRI